MSTTAPRGFGLATVVAVVTVIAVGAGACSGDSAGGDRSANTAITAPVERAPATAAQANDDYCVALAEMAAAQPATQSNDDFEAAMSAYADAVAHAAEVAPAADASVLADFADALRLLAADPTAPGTGERMGSFIAPMATIASTALRDCGVEFAS